MPDLESLLKNHEFVLFVSLCLCNFFVILGYNRVSHRSFGVYSCQCSEVHLVCLVASKQVIFQLVRWHFLTDSYLSMLWMFSQESSDLP